jgi:adenosylhomocysteine nucleosidase
MSTLVCFALKEEAAAFGKIAAGKSDVSILLVGIGRQNAGKSLRDFLLASGSVPASGAAGDALIAGTGGSVGTPGGSLPTRDIRREGAPNRSRGGCVPQFVLTCGFAGGLNPDLKLGDVVFEIPSRGSRGDEAQLQIGNPSEPPHVGCHEKLLAAGAKPAKFFCADRIATTVAEKKKLRDETGADAVEMESAAIHVVCREHGIPCATVRVISDTADEDLPLDFNALSKPDKSLDFGKLFPAIARSPEKIRALMQLRKKTRFAAKQLSKVLEKVICP